jgi:hypothetical protein
VKQLPSLSGSVESNENNCQSSDTVTPTTKPNSFNPTTMSPFTNTRASVVRAEWFWASIQICCRASECLYEFTRPKAIENCSKVLPNNLNILPPMTAEVNPPNKRIKLSSDNLLSHETLNSSNQNANNDSPRINRLNSNTNGINNQTPTTTNNNGCSTINVHKQASSNNLLQTNDICDSPSVINQLNTTNNANNSTLNNNRLSTGVHNNRNNMSNNNLSTSASLLDATTDDAMSSNI